MAGWRWQSDAVDLLELTSGDTLSYYSHRRPHVRQSIDGNHTCSTGFFSSADSAADVSHSGRSMSVLSSKLRMEALQFPAPTNPDAC